MTRAFNNEKYLNIQMKEILKRISTFGGKLYLEFGGKLIDDNHAARVLPGFEPDSKLQLLLKMKEKSEIIVVINTEDIKNHKIRGDNGITYDVEVERFIILYRKLGLSIAGVVFSMYEKNQLVDKFIRKVKNMGIKVYKHYKIAGYPQNIPFIVSDDGLGKNEYVITSKPLIIVTAPGPGSGKLATCLSQLYHDNKNGVKSGYAKYETFPIWNLPVDHPVNKAYEAATLDLEDINMVDPYHERAYGIVATNYNRDVDAFMLLKEILTQINGKCRYQSPTDMGVNMVGFAIEDDNAVRKASYDEIVRRYCQAKKDYLLGKIDDSVLNNAENLLKECGLSLDLRKCIKPCLTKAEKTGCPCVSIELNDGSIVTGKRSDLLTATSAALLNAVKRLAGIDDKLLLLSPAIIEPIQVLKVNDLHNANPKIHGEEILIALAIEATKNEIAKRALDQLKNLDGCEAHSSCLLASTDLKVLNKLGIRVTEQPESYIYKVQI